MQAVQQQPEELTSQIQIEHNEIEIDQNIQDEKEIWALQKKLFDIVEKQKRVKCTCPHNTPATRLSSSISSSTPRFQYPENKSEGIHLYVLDVQALQKETHSTFNHLSHMYSELLKHPNTWFSRPRVADMCHEKAHKKTNSFVNSLTKEWKAVLANTNLLLSTKALRLIPKGEEPQENCFLIAHKEKGKPVVLFQYLKVS